MNRFCSHVGVALFLILLWSRPAAIAAQQPEETAPRPNLIFIYTDDQRFDAVGANGNSAIRTPHLDQLCQRGLRFINAHVVMSRCRPRRAAE